MMSKQPEMVFFFVIFLMSARVSSFSALSRAAMTFGQLLTCSQNMSEWILLGRKVNEIWSSECTNRQISSSSEQQIILCGISSLMQPRTYPSKLPRSFAGARVILGFELVCFLTQYLSNTLHAGKILSLAILPLGVEEPMSVSPAKIRNPM